MIGIPVSGPLLMAKAQQLFSFHPDIDSGRNRMAEEIQTEAWYRGVSIQGESLSTPTDTVEPFKIKLNNCYGRQGHITEVFNCDETGLYWRVMPRKTLVTAREKDAKDYKKPKDRVTLIACVNVTDSIKLPLVFIHMYCILIQGALRI